MFHHNLNLPEGDILIHSGDGLNRGTLQELVSLNLYFNGLKNQFKHIIYVPGNHDKIFETDPGMARIILNNAEVLIDQEITLEGLKIYGSPYTKLFMNWSFMGAEPDLKRIFNKIPKDLDILITHGPPYSILDANREGILCGSQSLYDQVIKVQPKIHVFGHIHESSGLLNFNKTHFVNAAVLNDSYKITNEPKIFFLETKK